MDTRHKIVRITVALVLAAVWVILGRGIPQARAATAQVAIYDGAGTWRSGRIMIENLLDAHKIRWEEISAAEINAGKLDGFQVLWVPGGWAADYLRQISDRGDESIRNFVKKGGAYIGSCAGSYFAADRVNWRGTTYQYSVDLFAGTAIGDIQSIATYPAFALTSVVLDPTHPLNAGLNPTRTQLYGGGPYFAPDNPAAIAIAGRYGVDQSKSAVITFNYGAGRVLLTGSHPEIGIRYATCDCAARGAGPDSGADWDYAWAMVQWALGNPTTQSNANQPRATVTPQQPANTRDQPRSPPDVLNRTPTRVFSDSGSTASISFEYSVSSSVNGQVQRRQMGSWNLRVDQ